MNILVINSKRGHSRTLPVPRHWPWLLAAVLVVVPVLMGVGGYLLVSQLSDQPEYTPVMTERFSTHLEEQQKALESLDRLSQEQFRALTLKLAQAQARLVRLDALGERLVEVADIDGEEVLLDLDDLGADFDRAEDRVEPIFDVEFDEERALSLASTAQRECAGERRLSNATFAGGDSNNVFNAR